jgi:DNA-binding response OmpR family regulator
MKLGDPFGLLPQNPADRLPVLVVTDHPTASRWLLLLFADTYFHVTLATSFAEAKNLLSDRKPALLVSAVQLGEFNGLGLVLRAKAANPELRAVVLSRVADPVLQADAEKLGATFVSLPIEQLELRAAIIRTLFQPAISGVAPIRAPFERRRLGSADPEGSMSFGAVERHRRDALFPPPSAVMVNFDGPRTES